MVENALTDRFPILISAAATGEGQNCSHEEGYSHPPIITIRGCLTDLEPAFG